MKWFLWKYHKIMQKGDYMDKIKFWIGKVLAILFAGAAAYLLICLNRLQMLPDGLLSAIIVLFGLIIALVMLLTWTGRGKIRMILGVLLAVVMIAGLTIGNVYVHKTLDTYEKISGVKTETINVGIYVRSDDTNDFDEVAATYLYGILQKLDREGTDGALAHLKERYGTDVAYQEYQRLPEVVDALLNREVDAIILNEAFLSLLQEMEGYEDIMSRIRQVVIKEVEIEIVQPTEPEKTEPENPDDSTEPEKEKDLLAPFGIYISGTDIYGKITTRSRSDVNIMAVVNPKTRQILLVSTPRDYFVPLSISDGIPDKLTHAGNYGVNVSKDTLGMLYGIDMDYYFRVNFQGFEKVIDALDGVTVYSEYAFTSTHGGVYFSKGENYMNGAEALMFSRERYSFEDGDQQRGRNQMAVIKAVINKIMSPAILTSYTQILAALEDNIDTSVPMDVIGALVSMQLENGGSWNVVTYSVSGTGGSEIPYSMGQYAYVMWPDYKTVDHAKELIQSVLNGEIIEEQ